LLALAGLRAWNSRSPLAPTVGIGEGVRVSERVEPIPAGRHGLSSEQVHTSRRSRLTASMVEAVAIHGYPGTTIGDLVALARISKTDFYGVFGSKEECFWAAFEECLERFAGRLAASVDGVEEGRPQLAAAITALADTIESEPAAVSLVLVDSLALGPAADDPRARSQERFESMLRNGVAAAGGTAMTPLRARGVVIGVRRLAYRAIRDADSSRLRRGARDLVDWIVDCATAPPSRELSGYPEPVLEPSAEIAWDAPPADWTSRVGLSPREPRLGRKVLGAVGRARVKRARRPKRFGCNGDDAALREGNLVRTMTLIDVGMCPCPPIPTASGSNAR
jgi:AcrR family transcriptional regulator